MIIEAVVSLKPGWSLVDSEDGTGASDGEGSWVLFDDQQVVDSLNNGMDDDPPWTVEFQTVSEPSADERKAEWLIWSHHHNCWWGPDHSGYTNDVWKAGRYILEDTKQYLYRGGWPRHGQKGEIPPEVVVLAPEFSKMVFTLQDIRGVSALMMGRVKEATQERIDKEAGL